MVIGLKEYDDVASDDVFYRGLDIRYCFIATLPSLISLAVCGVSHAGYSDPVGYGDTCGRTIRIRDGYDDHPSRQRGEDKTDE